MRFGFAVMVGVLVSAACEDLVSLVPVGGQACLVDFDGAVYVGEEAVKRTCHLGKTEYSRESDNSYSMECVGSSPMMPEQCEDGGRDQDCRLGPDNVSRPALTFSNTCFEDALGVCKMSFQDCINDTWVCVPPAEFGPEICAGYHEPPFDFLDDEDCDGFVNEDDDSLVLSGPVLGYDGPPETLNVGQCRGYVRECKDGEEIKRGQILPTQEICQADFPGVPQLDENCNGLIDDSSLTAEAQAILISLDTSGSMEEEIEAAIDTICASADNGNLANSLVSIQLVGPYSYDGVILPGPNLVRFIDFVPFGEACDELLVWYTQQGLSGGSEYVAYGIIAANDPTNPVYVEWPAGDFTRRVVAFSDEGPMGFNEQTLEDEGNYMLDFERAIAACQEHQFSINVFSEPTIEHLWKPMTEPCNGWVEPLTDDPNEMRNKFASRLGVECAHQ